MGFFFSLVTGVGVVFRMFITFNFKVYYYFYLLYWFLAFAENTTMITLWYIWSSDTELWYHDWTISGVIVLYFLSLVVKILHSYFNNKSGTNIMTLIHNHVCDSLFKVTERQIVLHVMTLENRSQTHSQASTLPLTLGVVKA